MRILVCFECGRLFEDDSEIPMADRTPDLFCNSVELYCQACRDKDMEHD